MKDTLLYILQHIVDHPDEVTVTEETTDERTLFHVHAHQEDIGQIIGKNGRIIKALRDLIKLMATKHALYVDIAIDEDVPAK